MPILKKLKVVVKTGSKLCSGTDAPIYLVLVLPGGGKIYRLPTRREDLEAGEMDIYDLALQDGPNLQDLLGLVLVNGMTGPSPAWRLLWIKIQACDETGHSWGLVDAMVERWLDSKEDLSPALVLPLQRPFLDLGVQDVVGTATVAVRSVGES